MPEACISAHMRWGRVRFFSAFCGQNAPAPCTEVHATRAPADLKRESARCVSRHTSRSLCAFFHIIIYHGADMKFLFSREGRMGAPRRLQPARGRGQPDRYANVDAP